MLGNAADISARAGATRRPETKVTSGSREAETGEARNWRGGQLGNAETGEYRRRYAETCAAESRKCKRRKGTEGQLGYLAASRDRRDPNSYGATSAVKSLCAAGFRL
jgi:hypothetical protein